MKTTLLFITTALISFNAFSQCIPNITDSLIAQWDFSGNANDTSGNGHHGTAVNATLDTSRCGAVNSAYHFSGMGPNQYIDVPDSPSLNLSNTDFSISAWTYQDDTASSNNTIVSKRIGSTLTDGYIFLIGVGQTVGFAVAGGSPGSSWLDAPTRICPRVWNHLVVTYTNSTQTLSIYINSNLDTTAAGIISPTATSSVLRIGYDSLSQPFQFNGRIDDIRIYNRALDSCDIDSLYRNICPPVPPAPCFPSSVNEIAPMFGIDIYPNPGTGYFNIILKQFPTSKTTLIIRNIIGEQLQQFNLTTKETKLKLEQPNGIYFLTVSTENETYTSKIIIQQ